MSNTSCKVFFPEIGGSGWMGGKHYINNLKLALIAYRPEIELDVCRLKKPVLKNGLPHRAIRKLRNTLFNPGHDQFIQHQFDQMASGPYAVFTNKSTLLNLRKEVPKIYWIADFQHLHLQDMFTQRELDMRDRNYRMGIEMADLVVLSSEDARKDFENFCPEMTAKVRVMNFVANIPSSVYEQNAEELVRKYHLPQKFFFVPNQFWKHKNHELVIEALQLLRQSGNQPFVVFSGNTLDYRNDRHFAGLIQKVSLYDLRDQVAFLGVIPIEELYGLMRQSIALINPSLFEGWSTTVEESKSLGKKIILSDLGVHKEQNPEKAMYFRQNNAGDLANKMGECWNDTLPGSDNELEKKAREALPGRVEAYAARFKEIIDESLQLSK